MKNFKLIPLILILLIAPIFAASSWTTNAVQDRLTNGTLIRFSAALDSVDTLYSNGFSLAKYDKDSFTTYPIAYGKILSSASGKPRVTTKVQGTYDNTNWFDVATIGITADSLETYGKGTTDFGNVKCLKYRIVYYGTTGNRSDTTVQLILYLYRED